jgi:Holliday junction resolvase RusA-like endonuclease
MKMKIAFFVPGEAKTAGSKNAFLNKKIGKINVTHANPKTKVWMDTVKYFAFKEVGKMCLLTEAISLMLIFYRDRPKGHFNSKGILKESAPKYPTPKPDVTKLCRAVEDALTGIIWHDDSQVCEQYNKKLYVTNQDLPYSNKPGVQITIETME